MGSSKNQQGGAYRTEMKRDHWRKQNWERGGTLCQWSIWVSWAPAYSRIPSFRPKLCSLEEVASKFATIHWMFGHHIPTSLVAGLAGFVWNARSEPCAGAWHPSGKSETGHLRSEGQAVFQGLADWVCSKDSIWTYLNNIWMQRKTRQQMPTLTWNGEYVQICRYPF